MLCYISLKFLKWTNMFQISIYVAFYTFQFSKASHIAKICVGEIAAVCLQYMQRMHEEIDSRAESSTY